MRPIRTIYYGTDKSIVRTNAAKHSDNAVGCAVRHMRHNHYNAKLCEVFDSQDGTLYAVLKQALVKGESVLTIIYKREAA
jgi:hypothetical protein